MSALCQPRPKLLTNTGGSAGLAPPSAAVVDAAQRLLVPADIDGDAPHLTPREIDILRLTRDGKSAWVAGQILAISEHTVNFHLRNIQRKINTTSKHQAVLAAMRLGLI